MDGCPRVKEIVWRHQTIPLRIPIVQTIVGDICRVIIWMVATGGIRPDLQGMVAFSHIRSDEENSGNNFTHFKNLNTFKIGHHNIFHSLR